MHLCPKDKMSWCLSKCLRTCLMRNTWKTRKRPTSLTSASRLTREDKFEECFWIREKIAAGLLSSIKTWLKLEGNLILKTPLKNSTYKFYCLLYSQYVNSWWILTNCLREIYGERWGEQASWLLVLIIVFNLWEARSTSFISCNTRKEPEKTLIFL